MDRLDPPVRRVRPEPVARQPEARLHHLRPARRAASTAASAGSRRTRRSSRRRSRARPTTTSSSASSPPTTTRSSTTTGRWCCSDINGALRRVRPACTTSATAATASSASRSTPALAHDSAGTEAAARDLHERIARPQPDGQDPGDRRGRRADPGDDRRGPQHQRHADLQPRPLRRGDGGVHRRARGVRRDRPAPTCRRWPAWPASSSAGSTPRSTAGSRRSARPRRWRCAARAPSPRASSPTGCSSETFSGPRWDALAARGARVQRPLWASTSTKNPAYPDTLYVDELIGPDTVNTLPEATIEAFADHGTLARTRRRRRRRGRGGVGRASPTSASTSTTSPTRSSAKASPASRRASTSCSTPSTPRPPSSAPRADPIDRRLCQETRRLRSFFLTQNGIRWSAPDGAGAAGTRAGGAASTASLRSPRRCRRR